MDMLGRQDLREAISVSTALGFLVHLMVTLAGVLQVPLRLVVQQPGCSRSYLSDPFQTFDGSSSSAEWPLFYGRGLSKKRFEVALCLLRDGLHQFLYSRGYYDEKRVLKANLLECAHMIIQNELYG